MKQLARQHVWWSKIDKDIEQLASSCEICKVENAAPAKEFQSWPAENQPWERIHIDFAGPIFNAMWLIIVDSFSNFPFVIQLTGTTTSETTEALKSLFAIEGIPKTIVSDNGPQLTAHAFKQFCNQLGINHVTTAPFHPASNGLAERFVRTFKTSVRKNIEEGWTLKEAVTKFLMTYRALPNAESKSAAELLHGRPCRTKLAQVFEKPTAERTDATTKFQSGQMVYIKNFSRGKKWVKAQIHRKLGKMMYIVRDNTGFHKRHQNQIKQANNQTSRTSEDQANIPMSIEFPIEVETNSRQQQQNQHRQNHQQQNLQQHIQQPQQSKARQQQQRQQQQPASNEEEEECTMPRQDLGEETPRPASPMIKRSTRTRRPSKRLQFKKKNK